MTLWKRVSTMSLRVYTEDATIIFTLGLMIGFVTGLATAIVVRYVR